MARKFSKKQVQVWLYTVLGPVIGGLRIERKRTAEGHWSFRCTTMDFEYLMPIRRMLSPPFVANLEQVWRFFSAHREEASAHDAALEILRDKCAEALKVTLRADSFRALIAKYEVDSDEKFLAEYIVNDVTHLPEGFYSTAEFWNKNVAQFLGLREDAPLVESFVGVKLAGVVFYDAVERLHDLVDDLRIRLADDYKLPPVDPTDAGLA